MPKGTRAHRCVEKLRKAHRYGKAIAICQAATGQSYATGEPMRGGATADGSSAEAAIDLTSEPDTESVVSDAPTESSDAPTESSEATSTFLGPPMGRSGPAGHTMHGVPVFPSITLSMRAPLGTNGRMVDRETEWPIGRYAYGPDWHRYAQFTDTSVPYQDKATWLKKQPILPMFDDMLRQLAEDNAGRAGKWCSADDQCFSGLCRPSRGSAIPTAREVCETAGYVHAGDAVSCLRWPRCCRFQGGRCLSRIGDQPCSELGSCAEWKWGDQLRRGEIESLLWETRAGDGSWALVQRLPLDANPEEHVWLPLSVNDVDAAVAGARAPFRLGQHADPALGLPGREGDRLVLVLRSNPVARATRGGRRLRRRTRRRRRRRRRRTRRWRTQRGRTRRRRVRRRRRKATRGRRKRN